MKALVRLITHACAAFALAGLASAQSYPDRPVRIIVPFAPAGPTDVIARVVADKLSANLGKQFYIENRAGAGGNTGTAAAATSAPDGYTLIVGSTPHLSGEIFRSSQDVDLVTVQFTGAGPAIQNTVGGHTPLAFTAMPPAAPHIKDGKLRALMVTSEKRAPGFPDVPTAAEAGLAGQEAYTLTGMLAPAGTPKEVIMLLHSQIVKIVALPEVKKRLGDLGFEVVANSPDQFAARITTETEKWAKVIRDAKIKVEGAK